MRCAVLVAMLASIVVASPRAARANGGNTHVWISLHAIDHLPEGRLKQMLSRPELRSALDRVEVVDSTGKSYALTADTQWGTAVGNVVKIRAAEDWAAGETFTVTVKPGLDFVDGFQMEAPFRFTFSTAAGDPGAPTSDPTPHVGEPDVGSVPDAGCCSSSGGGRGTALLAGVVGLVLLRRRRVR
jgi:hypothetical protein